MDEKVLICNNCKEYWISKNECICGSKSLTETHQSNKTRALNYYYKSLINNDRLLIVLNKYFNYLEENDYIKYFITKVELKISKVDYRVIITSHKPGLLIGEYGSRLDDMCNFLTHNYDKKSDKKVHVVLEDSDLWLRKEKTNK